MPAKSQAQFRLMQLAKHNPQARERLGIPLSVAKEFTTGKMPKVTANAVARQRANAIKARKP